MAEDKPFPPIAHGNKPTVGRRILTLVDFIGLHAKNLIATPVPTDAIYECPAS